MVKAAPKRYDSVPRPPITRELRNEIECGSHGRRLDALVPQTNQRLASAMLGHQPPVHCYEKRQNIFDITHFLHNINTLLIAGVRLPK